MLRKLWKIAIAFQVALVVMMLMVTPAVAAEIRGYDDVVIASGDVVNDDLYIAGNRIVINGVVNGDVLAAGSTIIIEGTVNGDVFALGSTIELGGEISGSVRVAASTVKISGMIGEDLVVAGSTVDLRTASEIGRDLVFGASSITVESSVTGDILGMADVVEMADGVGGDTEIQVNHLIIGSTADINGNLIYVSENEADIHAGSHIAGEITRKIPVDRDWYFDWIPVVDAWTRVISYLMVLLVGILIILVTPRKSREAIDTIKTKPWKSLGWGALIFFVAPIAMVILILTIVGIPVGIFGAIAYGILIFVSQLVVSLLLGQWIVTRLNMEESKGSLVLALFIGFTILTLVKLIPWMSFILWWPTVLFGMGAIALLFVRKNNNHKEVEAEVIAESTP